MLMCATSIISGPMYCY